jgi:HPt (histidine-containing phosphotransfer) domain-containing protein
VNILENINISDSQTELYITTIHGIKSALANIGEINLSQIALELEKAARQKNLELLLNETPAFINMLKSLIVKYKPAEDTENASDNDSISEENRLFLHKKLAVIITACDAYDKKSAKTAIDEIKSLEWPKHIKSLIKDISVHLLHSEFSEIAQLIDKFLKN